MKLPQLRCLAAAGAIAAATIMLAAPAANARPADYGRDCRSLGGHLGSVTHYEFGPNGNVTSTRRAYYCDLGGTDRLWYD
jgi:hypothetical protein